MRVFIYCRVARDDTFALEHQRFLLQLYAKRAGYTIIGAADEYGSGLTLDRPGMGKVTQAVLAGEVDVVLVHSLTRIGREWGMTQSYRPAHPAQGQAPLYQRTLLVQRKRRDPFLSIKMDVMLKCGNIIQRRLI